MPCYKSGNYSRVLNRRRRERQNRVNTIIKARNRNGVQASNWEPWTPASEAQQMAIDSLAKFTGYGGMPGAGKSSLLLMLSNYYPTVQIFRKTSTNLDGLIRDSHNMLDGSGAQFNRTKHIWRDVPGEYGKGILQFCCSRLQTSHLLFLNLKSKFPF